MPNRLNSHVKIPTTEQTYVQLLTSAYLPESTPEGRVLFAVKFGAHLIAFICKECTDSSHCEAHVTMWRDWGVLASVLSRSAGYRGRVVGEASNAVRVISEPREPPLF